jgi:BCCT family betaine/carnitine transporter
VFGVGSTIVSFVILGNYSLGKQVLEGVDFIGRYQQSGDLYSLILSIIQTLPHAWFVLLLVLVTMVAFYATSFDSIALIASCYSYRELGEGQTPHRAVMLAWCLLLIAFPIALVFSESSMSNLQSVSIIAAFPVGMIILLIIASFFKDANALFRQRPGR